MAEYKITGVISKLTVKANCIEITLNGNTQIKSYNVFEPTVIKSIYTKTLLVAPHQVYKVRNLLLINIIEKIFINKSNAVFYIRHNKKQNCPRIMEIVKVEVTNG